jgi:hypothetical protein
MSKSELLADLKARGKFDVNDSRDQGWIQAFALHYKETKIRLSVGCGGCFTRVRNWLKS